MNYCEISQVAHWAKNPRDIGLIIVLGRSPEGEYDNPLQYSWRIPMDKGAWHATVHRVAKSQI